MDALHSIRSLLCTATNSTPRERLFSYNRKSTSGTSLPSWLTAPGRALLKNHTRCSKYDPLVEEVNLIDCSPQYAVVRHSSGREQTVSLRDLAPIAEDSSERLSQRFDTTSNIKTTLELEHTTPTIEIPELIEPSQLENSNDLTENVEHLITQQQRTRPYNLRNHEA